jgi:hypothetical protein
VYARDSKWICEEYLHEVLTAELAPRAESAIRQRIRDARFPETKTLDGFDFSARGQRFEPATPSLERLCSR